MNYKVNIPGKNEMYLANGQLGQAALLDLFSKVNSLYPTSIRLDTVFSTFLSNPLKYCRDAITNLHIPFVLYREENIVSYREENTFLELLRAILPCWEAASPDSQIRSAQLGKFDRKEYFESLVSAPWRSPAEKVDGNMAEYDKNSIGRYNWLDVDWHFPDNIIAQVLGVTRQAVSYKRNQFSRKQDAVSRAIGSHEREEILMRHIRFARYTAISGFVGIAPEVVDALSAIPIDRARKALSMFPDVSREEQERLSRNVSTMFKSGNTPFAPEYFGTIELMGIEKGMSDSEITRLLLTAFPNALSDSDAALEERAQLPKGAVAIIRGKQFDWTEAFKHLPNVRDAIVKVDPFLGLEDAKGVSREEAARLLYMASMATEEIKESVTTPETVLYPLPVAQAEIPEEPVALPETQNEIPKQ